MSKVALVIKYFKLYGCVYLSATFSVYINNKQARNFLIILGVILWDEKEVQKPDDDDDVDNIINT